MVFGLDSVVSSQRLGLERDQRIGSKYRVPYVQQLERTGLGKTSSLERAPHYRGFGLERFCCTCS